ncbi:MAG: VOC family protein [Pseudomonadota bacterium]
MGTSSVGKPVWFDLTVPNAAEVRDFYAAVCGWRAEDHPMENYADFSMYAPDGTRVSGICHAKGVNASLPPVWLPYVVVEDLDATLLTAEARGGTIIDKRTSIAVIQDPAGAYMAFWQAAPETV